MDGRFKKGKVPWNKGLKGTYTLPNENETSFKDGNKHPRYKPVGSERVDKDGYTVLKVADRHWELKHRHIWKLATGLKIPQGNVILFKDGNIANLEFDNLLMISRKQLAVYNKHFKKTSSGEINESILNLINLKIDINEKKKRRIKK